MRAQFEGPLSSTCTDDLNRGTCAAQWNLRRRRSFRGEGRPGNTGTEGYGGKEFHSAPSYSCCHPFVYIKLSFANCSFINMCIISPWGLGTLELSWKNRRLVTGQEPINQGQEAGQWAGSRKEEKGLGQQRYSSSEANTARDERQRDLKIISCVCVVIGGGGI